MRQLWGRIRSWHIHQWFLRLDDDTLECTMCGAIKRERKRHKAR